MEEELPELPESLPIHCLSQVHGNTARKGSIRVQKLLTSIIFYNLLPHLLSF